jgi:hypothetical protein
VICALTRHLHMNEKILATTKYVPGIVPIQEHFARLLSCKVRDSSERAEKWLPHVLRFCGARSPIYSPILFRELDLVEYVSNVLLETRAPVASRSRQFDSAPYDFFAGKSLRGHLQAP